MQITDRRRVIATTGIATALFVGAGVAPAQDYPSKPVRFILAFTAGGALDIVARTVTQKLSENMRSPMVMENRAGAGGIIGTEIAAKSPPDGYTIFVCNVTNAIYPSLYRKTTYDPLKDFIPITLAASFSFVLSVHPAMPVKNVAELVALAKKRPDQIVYGSSGIGSPPHFAGEMMRMIAGVRMIHVPYAGNPQAQQDLVGGHIQVLFINTANALPLIEAGRVRGLAVSSAKRTELAPNIPTVAESGLPGFDMISWVGFCAPARTAEAVVAKLNAEITKALSSSELKKKLLGQGFEISGLSLGEFYGYYKSEIDKYEKLIREAKIETQ